jgi:hypothetical protein
MEAGLGIYFQNFNPSFECCVFIQHQIPDMGNINDVYISKLFTSLYNTLVLESPDFCILTQDSEDYPRFPQQAICAKLRTMYAFQGERDSDKQTTK